MFSGIDVLARWIWSRSSAWPRPDPHSNHQERDGASVDVRRS